MKRQKQMPVFLESDFKMKTENARQYWVNLLQLWQVVKWQFAWSSWSSSMTYSMPRTQPTAPLTNPDINDTDW